MIIQTKWFFLVIVIFLYKTYADTNGETKEHLNETAKSQFDFIQIDYDIILERAEFPNFNRSYIKYVHGGFVPFNRTQRVLNYTSEAIKDMDNMRIDVQVYKFMSNEYRFFPITVSVNACVEYQLNAFRSKELLTQFSNMNPCNLKKGVYYLYNGLPDFSKFPPLMPRGRYKMVTSMFQESNFILQGDFYGAVKDKPKEWK